MSRYKITRNEYEKNIANNDSKKKTKEMKWYCKKTAHYEDMQFNTSFAFCLHSIFAQCWTAVIVCITVALSTADC